MSSFVVKLDENEYLMWSSSSDSPASNIMTREEIVESLAHIDIQIAKSAADERVRRADLYGSSLLDDRKTEDPLKHLRFNRMGEGETRMKAEDLYAYLKGEKPREECESIPWDDDV